MKKLLSLEKPPIDAYQGNSFLLAALLAYPSSKNIVYLNYSNLDCGWMDDYQSVALNFTNSLWENYRLMGIISMNLFHRKHISRENFIGFIRERIDQNQYILMYCIDEFYLSYSEKFQIEHFIHDVYIYGYDDESFYVMAYKNGQLQCFPVATEEIVQGFYEQDGGDDISFCVFRVNENYQVEVDLSIIKGELNHYVNSLGYREILYNQVFGVESYEVVAAYLNTFLDSELSKEMDLRVFRTFWEHKVLMKNRLLEIEKRVPLKAEIAEQMQDIEHKSLVLFRMMIKYQLTRQTYLLADAINLLSYIREKDIVVVQAVVDALELAGY